MYRRQNRRYALVTMLVQNGMCLEESVDRLQGSWGNTPNLHLRTCYPASSQCSASTGLPASAASCNDLHPLHHLHPLHRLHLPHCMGWQGHLPVAGWTETCGVWSLEQTSVPTKRSSHALTSCQSPCVGKSRPTQLPGTLNPGLVASRMLPGLGRMTLTSPRTSSHSLRDWSGVSV